MSSLKGAWANNQSTSKTSINQPPSVAKPPNQPLTVAGPPNQPPTVAGPPNRPPTVAGPSDQPAPISPPKGAWAKGKPQLKPPTNQPSSVPNKGPTPQHPPNDDRDPAFVMLPGDFTGDIWHCAAATVLAHKKPDPLIPKHYPITVVGVIESQQHNSFSRGSVSFDYFRSIGVPVLLARLSITGPNVSLKMSMSKLKETYLAKIAQDYVAKPNASFETTWDPKSTSDAFPSPNSPWNQVQKIKQGQSIRLEASTTIVMQFLTPLETRQERMAALHIGLTTGIDMKPGLIQYPAWKERADALVTKLKGLIKNEYTHTDKEGKSIILFNYRKGDVNRQHDSNLELFGHVRSVAKAVNAEYEVVPVLVGLDAGDPDRYSLKGSLDLFPPAARKSTIYDKRTIPEFWRLVATDGELKNCVRGLIGGRSGSMDIAAFMGVNTCSWDEPDLITATNARPAAYEETEEGSWRSQQTQYLRLYNQRAIMSVIHLNAKTFSRSQDGKHIYKGLNEAELKAWVGIDPGAAEAHPIYAPLNFNDVSVVPRRVRAGSKCRMTNSYTSRISKRLSMKLLVTWNNRIWVLWPLICAKIRQRHSCNMKCHCCLLRMFCLHFYGAGFPGSGYSGKVSFRIKQMDMLEVCCVHM